MDQNNNEEEFKGKWLLTDPVEEIDEKTRVDSYLSKVLNKSRANIQKLIEKKFVKKNEKEVKANHKVKTGEIFSVFEQDIEPNIIRAEKIPLDILYEDKYLLVINKQRGMVVHPAPGHYSGTLVNALLNHCEYLSDENGKQRPGIVHRLDKDTSGVMLVAKTNEVHRNLSLQIKNKEAKRIYIAIVRGNLKTDSGIIETQLNRDKKDRKKIAVVDSEGRKAITKYEVLERFGKYTVVRCKLLTGRTHQIRVHMEYINHPVVGDLKYSPTKHPFSIKGQALHSQKLSFVHPITKEVLTFKADLPSDMDKIIKRLKNGQF